ncbi:hypothetical protein BT96DRAFT_1022514 [Gymnopus androsaceus JB14]|uniref:Uncharacterized protein n=1 Tax=Gymnopus androsaceus JB14 TaxID=1447944 RepID=A0A6A4H9H2_9AGAR|nr:hypothetical protein BT96DRAFT_1022514 [Gymnopus androsaceus JB14]
MTSQAIRPQDFHRASKTSKPHATPHPTLPQPTPDQSLHRRNLLEVNFIGFAGDLSKRALSCTGAG